MIRSAIETVIQKIIRTSQYSIPYQIGTMIEIPRACLVADQLAQDADFFSFGTNDLTQMTLGISRDDSPKFIPTYIKNHILTEDPFVTIDISGVGKLMQTALQKARSAQNKKLHYGVCGEHGGDPKSISFCQKLNLDFVSCSPFRVPVARLAAAQVALNDDSFIKDLDTSR